MWHKAHAVTLAVMLFAACSGENAGGNPQSGGGFQPTPIDVIGVVPVVTKLDLLVMVDNSASMADKQAILAQMVPDWIGAFVEPGCIDPSTGQSVGRSVDGTCATGVLAAAPINDIHIGVISSSLGGHGATVCNDATDMRPEPHNNDLGHLISRSVGGAIVPTFGNKGFLFYNPSVPGALASASAAAAPFADMVKGAGQHGCGYEASLESVYRFLIDPDPYSTLRIDTSVGGFGQALLYGTDTALLQQRAEFLRPDSLVSILIVTDENDCSVIEEGQGFYTLIPPNMQTGKSVLKGSTSKCLENPNDKCCFNCGAQITPAGCNPPQSDPACGGSELLVAEDQPNIRCFDQKRRYGVDFLYPVQRYIDGFTKDKVPNRKKEMVENPLFADLSCLPGKPCLGLRDKRLVFVGGIVGVPWQSIAADPLDLTKGYKTAKQIADNGVWEEIVGNPLNAAGPIAPRDPHMIESIKPRTGLPGPDSSWRTDPKNGHEWDTSKDVAPNADLQYACIFDLASPTVCNQSGDCDCSGTNLAETKNPLCQNEQGAYTSTQTRGKAYPGTRILQVLQGVGDQAIVGSICPAQLTDATRADFGYRPSIDALLARLRGVLGRARPACFGTSTPVDPNSQQVACAIIEVFDAPTCNCDSAPGRRPARDELLTPEMKAAGSCRCEIVQLSGPAQSACRTAAPAGAGTDGWCYADPAQFGGHAACGVRPECPANMQNGVRFNTTASAPRLGATTLIRCTPSEGLSLPPVCL